MDKIEVITETVKVTSKNIDKAVGSKFPGAVYDSVKGELTVPVNKYIATKPNWLLVHDGERVRYFDELIKGTLKTLYTMFAGTQKECEAEIGRLKLVDNRDVEE